MSKKDLNVLIGGEAGQGLQTVGELFAKSAMRSGFSLLVTQTYESRVRGGHNTFSIRLGPGRIRAPRESIDLLVALNEETVLFHEAHLVSGGLIIADEAFSPGGERCLGVPYKRLTGDGFANIVALGVAASVLGLEETVVEAAIGQHFRGAAADTAEKNRRALESAYRWSSEQSIRFETLASPTSIPRRWMLNAHEAVALGALSAGMKFCAFYPMSPSTSIPLTLIRWANDMGVVVEQVEDEIAAINMAVGASYAGAPSLVPTSGGGFALMTEAVSLAAISETPVVIVVAQRPGPATGLATRTEQGDLEFVLHAGHGEFSRAIFAPGTIEECFHLTRKAFELAERFQGPIFILTDHFFADSYRDVDPVDVESLGAVVPVVGPSRVDAPYLRYRITEDGISPRIMPGKSRHLVVADSHEHTEDGHMTEDLSVRPRMVDKRLRKARGIRDEVIPPSFEGDETPDVLFVSWGSSRGACEEAASILRSGGKSAASLHFSQVWPLVPEQFLDRLHRAGRVIGVESNATGQFARLIRREADFRVEQSVLRYDGLAITPDYILGKLE